MRFLTSKKPNSHYMINYFNDKIDYHIEHNQDLKKIFEIRKTLPWHIEWLPNDYDKGKLTELVSLDLIKEFPPLFDIGNSFITQTEHTIGIGTNQLTIQFT
jgi:methionine aminopeptidase